MTDIGPGSVSATPAGDKAISCGSACSAHYAVGTAVTLTATPVGATFIGWSGACTGAAPMCTVTMSSAQSVQATFGN